MSIDIIQKLKAQRKERFKKQVKSDPALANIRQITEIVVEEIMPDFKQELTNLVYSKITELASGISNGEDGAIGEKGDKGDKGEQGPQGLIGPKGDVGERGLTGNDGKDGKQGLRGLQGKIGATGAKGDKGDKGENGKDGSPDTLDQIVDKLNTLEDVLETKVIKGFWNIINTLQKNIKEKSGGGGMGNWITEQPSGITNGSNTSFTLTNNVASNGNAIILLYQGQVLEKGNQFNISGKNITTLFTPETGTFLFAMYVRT